MILPSLNHPRTLSFLLLLLFYLIGMLDIHPMDLKLMTHPPIHSFGGRGVIELSSLTYIFQANFFLHLNGLLKTTEIKAQGK
jgi:hypothetical protein